MSADARPDTRFDALIFDLGGVMVAHDNAVLYRRLVSRCRPDATSDQVAAIVREPGWGTGMPIKMLHAALVDRLGYAADWAVFRGDWCCHFALDPSMIAYVQGLARDHRVILFSNTNQEHWDHLVGASNGVLAGVERFLSHEIGFAKPSVAAFEHVARNAGIAPGRSIFFDDRPENVEGARHAGFPAEIFTDETALRQTLARVGLR